MSRGLFRAAQFAVVFDGQSLNVLPASPNNMPTVLMASYPTVPWVNVSIGGTSWTDLAKGVSSRLNPYAQLGLTTILVMNGGTRDIFNENDTGQTLYNDEVAFANAARTAGFDRIICVTLVKSTSMSAAQNTARTDHNTLLLADASAAFDGKPDLAANANLADPTNTTYYSDGTHWTASGASTASTIIAPVLEAIPGFPAAS